MTDVDTPPATSPAAIDAVPLRHPWRWVAAVVIVVLVGLFLYGAATNDAYRWHVFAEYVFNERVLQVGHLERFNPAIRAIEGLVTQPRFIECQRLAPLGVKPNVGVESLVGPEGPLSIVTEGAASAVAANVPASTTAATATRHTDADDPTPRLLSPTLGLMPHRRLPCASPGARPPAATCLCRLDCLYRIP